jgi:hypothetical protein
MLFVPCSDPDSTIKPPFEFSAARYQDDLILNSLVSCRVLSSLVDGDEQSVQNCERIQIVRHAGVQVRFCCSALYAFRTKTLDNKRLPTVQKLSHWHRFLSSNYRSSYVVSCNCERTYCAGNSSAICTRVTLRAQTPSFCVNNIQ